MVLHQMCLLEYMVMTTLYNEAIQIIKQLVHNMENLTLNKPDLQYVDSIHSGSVGGSRDCQSNPRFAISGSKT